MREIKFKNSQDASMYNKGYEQGRQDAERDFQNSDYWNDYLAKVIKDAKADAIDECKALFRKYILTKEIEGLDELLEQLKEQNNGKR